jgi:hypothetical protein
MDPQQANKRKQKDLMSLMLSKYDVKIEDEKSSDFYVTFAGPKDTSYEGVNNMSDFFRECGAFMSFYRSNTLSNLLP